MNRQRSSFRKRVGDAVSVLWRGYEGASLSGRYPWRQQMPAPTTEGLAAAPILGQRVAHAATNDAHIAAIVNSYVTDICGPDGPSLQHDDEAIVAAWNKWWGHCDAEGISSLGHLLQRLVRCFVIYGEGFVPLQIGEHGELLLLLLPVAQVDPGFSEDMGEAGWVISGIHIARDGRRLRYRVSIVPPDHPFATMADATWIDAADMLHVIDPMFAGAVRGISPLAPILTRSVETDTTIDALLKQQQVAALLSVFLTDPSGCVSLGDITDGNKVELSPAAVRLVPPDTTATVVTPPEASGGIDLSKHMLRSMAAGCGLPAWKVSADLSDVNFSSARQGDFAWRRRAAALQSLLVMQFLEPVFRRFVALEVAAERLNVDLATLADPKFIWPAFPQVDPLAETQADVARVAGWPQEPPRNYFALRPRSRRGFRRDRRRQRSAGSPGATKPKGSANDKTISYSVPPRSRPTPSTRKAAPSSRCSPRQTRSSAVAATRCSIWPRMQLPTSAPILLDHRATVADTVGKAENLRREGDTIVADCRISGDPALASLCERIADGTVDGVSIGYSVPKWAESKSASGERTRTAMGATLRHAALVAEPADSQAGIRSHGDGDDEGNRNGSIRTLCRALGMSRDLEDRAIDEQWSDADIRQAVHNRSHANIRTTSQTFDDPAFHRSAMTDALVSRMGGGEPQGASRELAGLSWPDMHRRHLRQAGQSVTGLSDVEVILRALTTSDMPLIAGAATNIVIRRTYDAAISPIAAAFGTRDLPDFRPEQQVLVDWTTLAVGKVGEMGEFRSSYVTETGEEISLYTIGGITGVSRQLWINGASALGNLSQAHGRRLAADVSDRMVAYIVQNSGNGPNMKDTVPVFSLGRGNILNLDVTSITTVIDSVLAARASASKRKGAGDVNIGATPTVWIVESTFEPTAIRALAQVAAAESANVNPLAGRLTIIAEPRLTNPDVSYLIAPPSTMDGAVRVSLSGSPGPAVEARWGFEQDAWQAKIRLDMGLGWLEWRSWTKLVHLVASP